MLLQFSIGYKASIGYVSACCKPLQIVSFTPVTGNGKNDLDYPLPTTSSSRAYSPRQSRATVIDPYAAYLRDRVKAFRGLTGRGGSGNLDSGDKWNFCLTSA